MAAVARDGDRGLALVGDRRLVGHGLGDEGVEPVGQQAGVFGGHGPCRAGGVGEAGRRVDRHDALGHDVAKAAAERLGAGDEPLGGLVGADQRGVGLVGHRLGERRALRLVEIAQEQPARTQHGAGAALAERPGAERLRAVGLGDIEQAEHDDMPRLVLCERGAVAGDEVVERLVDTDVGHLAPVSRACRRWGRDGRGRSSPPRRARRGNRGRGSRT
jgi:hypothetical protein